MKFTEEKKREAEKLCDIARKVATTLGHNLGQFKPVPLPRGGGFFAVCRWCNDPIEVRADATDCLVVPGSVLRPCVYPEHRQTGHGLIDWGGKRARNSSLRN